MAQPTLSDKLGLFPVAGASIFSAILRLLTRPFASGPKANTLFKDVVFAALRTNLSNISLGTELWLNSTTESEYLTFAKKQGFQPDTEVLGSGLKVHWLGNKGAEKVLLYFHGGGYVLAASAGHVKWLFDLQEELSKTTSIAVVLVSYTLAPQGQYPLQLQQAAESLEWLVESKKKKAADIFIGGDSAGGNMSLLLISHLLHPHPAVKSSFKLSEPLAGAILISPWAYFGTDDDSVKRNGNSDMVTAAAANRWSAAFLGKPIPFFQPWPSSIPTDSSSGSSKTDNYNQATTADPSWFKGLDSQAKDILIWGGGGEVLIDSIERLQKMLKQVHPRVEYVVQPGAAHEDFIFDTLLGYKGKAEGTVVVESWIKARL